MEGLEISEIALSEVVRSSDDFRLHSEFFSKEFLAVKNYFHSVRTVRLNKVAKIADGDHSKFPDNQIEEVRYLQARDITNNFLEISSNAFVSKEYFAKNQRSSIPSEAILLSIMGTVGDITITPRNFEPCMCNRALAIVRDIKDISPQFLFAYLTTKHAFNNIERQKNGGVQQRINLDVLGNIEIPLLGELFQNEIEKIVILAQDTRKNSKSTYAQAETMLLDTLGVATFLHSNETINIKSFKDSFAATGRLDAEYYQPKYEEIENACFDNAVHVKRIKEIQLHNGRGLQPDYADNGGLDVINSRHILDQELDYKNFEKTSLENWNIQAKAQVFRNDILTYTTGANIGRTQTYLSDEKALASNHVNILRIRDENPIYVAFYMNSKIGRLQTEQLSAGSAQQELYPKDIENFYIPFVAQTIQSKVTALVQQSFKLKAESERLLDVAKRAVEIAIEQNEKAGMAYIKANL